MTRYIIKTKMKPSQIIEEAEGYFGKEYGLEVTSKHELRICFEGGGGHVTIDACVNDETEVILETR